MNGQGFLAFNVVTLVVSLVATFATILAYFISMRAYDKSDFAKALPWAYAAFFGATLMVGLRIALGLMQGTPSAALFAILWGFLAFMSYLRVKVCRDELAKKVDRTDGKG